MKGMGGLYHWEYTYQKLMCKFLDFLIKNKNKVRILSRRLWELKENNTNLTRVWKYLEDLYDQSKPWTEMWINLTSQVFGKLIVIKLMIPNPSVYTLTIT